MRPSGAPSQEAGARIVAVIPARFASTRLPGKPLLEVGGRPLIAHVIARAKRAQHIGEVIVATDHEGILNAARAAGASAFWTRSEHPTGSDRIGELLPELDADFVINVQGDEPEVEPDLLDAIALALKDGRDPVVTASAPWPATDAFDNPNRVKVVTDLSGRALYFSRALIPHPRGQNPLAPRLHVGIYGYRKEALLAFLSAPRGPLETTEELEQLRFLELGMTIRVLPVLATPAGGIDTKDDFDSFAQRFARGNSAP